VRAAFFAAIERSRGPFVRTAFIAAAERARGPRLAADRRAWRASAFFEAADRPSRRNAPSTARDRFAEGRCPDRPRLKADFALRRVSAEAFPFAGTLRFTPERRAFDRPMAIACLLERAPCFPSRM